MCGRFDQSQTARYYASVFGWTDAVYDSEATPAYNVCPGTYRPLMHIQDGQPRVDDVFWSYRARWAEGKVPICINARMEKLTNRYWRGLLKNGRAVVAAEGWYEWTGEKGKKQPWHIHRKDHAPLYMLALANFGPFEENRAEAGFVLVTDDAAAGMLDIHDRKPVVLNAEDAKLWLDPALSPEQAIELARRTALPSEAFEWHKVSKEMNRAGAEGPQVVLPLGDE
ncbi:SOS response-associated peptidase family protein [Massilia solisilvae]|uniref:Abasic site processing protein n=1 Tax=Massilia solisilvae TaxID=1811225 RepID=A0ABT2BM88_9BURK|nr:SOS response-associated peptidase family protein [Massilia solisilvae]MCS0609627.1 SOS response-associated peptidase family protein [Massilia solisilvae]